MRFGVQKLAAALVTFIVMTALASAAAMPAAKVQIFTGEVSDAMCGAQHMMEGSAADCTHACVAKGSKYALIVGDKVYTLDTSDKASLDQLSQLAGKKAKITGKEDSGTIEVSSVAPAR